MAQIDRYTCEETIRRLDDYLDRELTPHEMQLVQEHLEVCALCASEYAFEGSALERLRDKLQRIPAPADLMTRSPERSSGREGRRHHSETASHGGAYAVSMGACVLWMGRRIQDSEVVDLLGCIANALEESVGEVSSAST